MFLFLQVCLQSICLFVCFFVLLFLQEVPLSLSSSNDTVNKPRGKNGRVKSWEDFAQPFFLAVDDGLSEIGTTCSLGNNLTAFVSTCAGFMPLKLCVVWSSYIFGESFTGRVPQ